MSLMHFSIFLSDASPLRCYGSLDELDDLKQASLSLEKRKKLHEAKSSEKGGIPVRCGFSPPETAWSSRCYE